MDSLNSLLIAEYIGMISAAVSGYLYAVKRELDPLGIFMAAFLTSLGGGMLRDIMVFRPLISFTTYTPFNLVIASIIVCWIFSIHKKADLENKDWFVISDAIGVVCFSIVGSIVALEKNQNIYGAVIIGFLNGVGGGILRDVTFSEVPWFFRTGLYGSIAMLVAFIAFLLYVFDFCNYYTIVLLLIFGTALRMIAYHRNWHLPPIKK